ncbi:MAG: efflux RND transporter periplasmic adaptor subunit [Woeseiaceae bacterium]|nr:efflux RND transporter periplasmic adaptor subunit [Woeseiaceae bacterium]
MNRSLITAAIAVTVGLVVGLVIGRSHAPSHAPADGSTEREILYWVAPMDPDFRRDGPGKSPMGMDLVPVYADDVDAQPGVVALEPTIVNRLGVRAATAERGSLPRRIDTVGYVSYDEDTLQHVHTRVEGWIENLAATAEGDPVREGELLFELYSPTLVNAQQEYLAALRSGNTGLASASKARLSALGMTDSEIDRLDRTRQVNERVSFAAARDGVITNLGVRDGMYVTPVNEVMTVATLDTLWVIAEVLERQSGWVQPGQAAQVEFDGLPGRVFEGQVDYVYPELDPVTRTLKARLRFDNPGADLRPNMVARVTIDGTATGPIVHVPREAVIRGGRGNRVIVDLGEGRFRATPVLVGIESGDRVAIRHGIREGDLIVVSGQFLIDSESSLDTSARRMAPADDREAER